MVLAFQFSEDLRLCAAGESRRVAAHTNAVGLPASLAALQRMTNRRLPGAGATAGYMAQDKKMSGGRLTLVLARRIGDAFLSREVTGAQIEAFLDAQFSRI
jgi:3-dehydroquinate synthetase